MRAFSLRTLLIAIAVVALWMVILARPSLFWMRVALTGTLATLGWWLVMAIAGRDEQRRFGIAAAVAGIGYLGIALHSTQQHQYQGGQYVLGRMLLTHQVLEGIAKLSGQDYPTQFAEYTLWDSQMFSETTYVPIPGPGATPGGTPAAPAGAFGVPGAGAGGFGAVAFRAVPGANATARYLYYLISGHCLFALLIGWIAGRAAKRWLKPRTEPAILPASTSV